MATGPFQYNPETREFLRRGSSRNWPVEEAALPDPPAVSLPEEAAGGVRELPEPSAMLVNPTPIRRRRRSYSASEKPPAKKSKLWRFAMWGLILFLLAGWLVMIAVLTTRSGTDGSSEREFKFDRGDQAAPDVFPDP